MRRTLIAFFALATPLLAEERGVLLLHFLQLPVGQETYEISGDTLHANFDYTERGSHVTLTATLRTASDFTPIDFEAHGHNYRPFGVDASFHATKERELYFTISGYAPFSVQMMLLRYWLAHGKPSRIAQRPAGDDLMIEETGHDGPLTRYALNSVVWGAESLWLNDRRELAAAVSYAGNLPIEAIREDDRAMLPKLIASATSDHLHWLEHSPVKPLAEGSFAITGARLIDGRGGPPVENATVIVRGGRIAEAGNIRVPQNVRKIDAHGATLLPGLWEMHAHFAQAEYGPAYLAAGVTTARDLGGEFEFLTAVRDAINTRGAIGPHLILAGLVDGSGPGTFGVNWADTPEQARAIVAKYKSAGFAQMKVYNKIRPEVLRAISAEAHRAGMTVTGHVPDGMTAVEGVEAGMDMINHFGPIQQTARAMGQDRAIAFFKEHRTVIDPTFAWGELLSRPKSVDIASFEPGFAKAPYTLQSMIGSAFGNGSHLENSFAILRALSAAGIPIVAGTDKAVPAHSLHRELELYVQAGLTPMQVIQIATLNSAKVMGMDREVGSIEAGKRADMILVDGNPLEDFAALRKVVRVVSKGRIFDPAELWKSVGYKP